MRADQTISGLTAFEQRGAGTDAERRAAAWLARELASTGRHARVETFWCRPNWALASAWHVALALAGSLLSVGTPRVGAILLGCALVFILADALIGISPGRRLTPERASQNVCADAPEAAADQLRLLITANYDAGRAGLVYRDAVRALGARCKRATRGLAPGWRGWIALAMLALLVIAVLRVGGHHGRVVSVVQLPLTVALVLVLAGLLEVGSAAYSPGAGDNASGVAVALELARALDAAPPRRLAVDIVLQGAGDGEAIGLRKHIRAHKRELPRANTVVVGVGPCGAGDPRYLLSDGSFVPLAYASSLCKLSAQLADGAGDLGADGHRGRGTSPAFPARAARLPAIAVCSLDARGLVPRSHQAVDVPAEIDGDAIARTVSFALMLIDAIDSAVPRRRERTSPTPA